MSTQASDRSILHVDMDAFFAAIEQLDRPELRGKPVIVGGDGPRGVVSTASYEARPYGVGSAMPMSIARRRCPRAIIVKPRFHRYKECSEKMFAILEDASPLVQPLSVDEAFLDVTGMDRLAGGPVAIARRIRQRIRDELHLTASIGVAPNKFLAKLASDLNKPDGLTVIEPGEVQAVLDPLPVSKMWGVGARTQEKLAGLGIHTIGQMRGWSEASLKRRFGSLGERFYRLSRGIDDRPVHADREAKSISHEHTYGQDVASPDAVRTQLLQQTELVCWRLRKAGLKAGAITVKIRYGDFETITRSATLKPATDLTPPIWRAARDVFDRWASGGFRPVRLIGMGVSQLSSGGQLELFVDAEDDRARQVDQTLDAIRQRFGKSAIRRAGPG